MQSIDPESITKEAYEQILESGNAGPIKHGYPAVIFHPDNTVTKIWAKKTSLFSSSRWKPYSARFISNAKKLSLLGVNVPKIINHLCIGKSHVHLVRYTSLEGTSIRELLASDPKALDIPKIAHYFYTLHEKGVLFRAIHLGNIIQMPGSELGLIDFTDVKFLNHPATPKQRAKNIATPLRYHQDIQRMQHAKLPDLAHIYLNAYKEKTASVNEKAFLKTVAELIRAKR